MTNREADLPRVFLDRGQWVRLVVVGIFVAFALARVVPDLVRVVYPLNVFDYLTDGDGVVVSARAREARPEAAQRSAARFKRKEQGAKTPAPAQIAVGDRVRIDRIKPFDRKAGLAGVGFTYDNPSRLLPVERASELRVLHLTARPELARSRFFAVLRIVCVGLGSILFLIKPSIATAAFFFFCLGTDNVPQSARAQSLAATSAMAG